MKISTLLATALLAGCYAHGWPFDDKAMCPGVAYPVSRADCERLNPVPRRIGSGDVDAGAADAATADAGDAGHQLR